MKKISARQNEILEIIEQKEACAISEIAKLLSQQISMPSLNRDLAQLVASKHIVKLGLGRTTRYTLSSFYTIFKPYDMDKYFDIEVDLRKGNKRFNHAIFKQLAEVNILNPFELEFLQSLRERYQINIKKLSSALYKKELERLTIELSWKSSQIEGNTYSLLETERLLLDKEAVATKSKEDAIMLLNHKVALDYILANPTAGKKLTLKFIEEVHSLLIQGLDVSRNIRNKSVGITGSFYTPLDNIYQIKENLEEMCRLINFKENVFEKALLALLLIAYIQPFEDGNKRTSRMISTALLVANQACPLSYRSVSSIDYKKATLLFYEQNNVTEFKKIFLEQTIFAYENYF